LLQEAKEFAKTNGEEAAKGNRLLRDDNKEKSLLGLTFPKEEVTPSPNLSLEGEE
jgi:hypothetical protein